MIAETPPPSEPATPVRTFGVDVVLTTAGKVIFVVCGALITLIVARHLGPDGQGSFAVAYSLTLLLVQVGSLGLPIANPYFAARDPAAQRAIVMHSLWIAGVVAAGLIAVVFGLKWVAPDTLRGLSWAQTAITLGALPAALATVYLQGVTLGQQRMVAFSVVEIAQIGTSLVALVVLLLVADPGLDAVLLVVAGGRYVSLAVALVSLRAVLRRPHVAQPGLVGRMLAHAVRVYVVALLSFALIRLDLMIVNALLSATDAGQYSIAAYITEALIVIPTVIATNLLPRIARSDDTGMTAAVLRGVTVVWGAICVLSLPVAVVGMPLALGHGYDDAVALYAWLVPATFCLGMLSALMAHYWVRGYPRALIIAWIAGLAFNVAGNALLLRPWGVAVAPILSSLTYALVLAAHVATFSREAGGLRTLRPSLHETTGLVRAAFGKPAG
jgi:O-antigen/teichoic acid export membrane protein